MKKKLTIEKFLEFQQQLQKEILSLEVNFSLLHYIENYVFKNFLQNQRLILFRFILFLLVFRIILHLNNYIIIVVIV